MGFLSAFLTLMQDFLESLFASSSPEVKKKLQIKQLGNSLKELEPPLYRADGFLLPTFPASLYQLYQILQPISETLATTIASQDKRASEKYRDYLLELVLTPEQQTLRKSFTFAERSAAVANRKVPADKLIEDQGKLFANFLRVLDSKSMQQAEILLAKIDALADFCEFDFNNLFAYFDPAFQRYAGQEGTVAAPSFHPVEVVEVIPVLLDLYYVLSRLDLSAPVIDVISILEAKRNKVALSDELKARTAKIFQSIAWLLQKRVGKDIILTIVRITKDDPEFKPELPTLKTDYVLQYKTRITEFFHSDSKKLLQDQETTEIQTLIESTFGSVELEPLQGYTDATNALIQEFTPFSLEWIRPLEIIKTFTNQYFVPHFQKILQSLIVEGYFNNRSLQSSLSGAYYYCESIPEKFESFEALFGDNQPCSVKILTAYLTELQKGMDFEKPLRQMIENMNGHAKAFVQQSVNQYAEVFNFSTIIIEDNKKSVPEYITNIRTLTSSTKNSESFATLEKEIGVFRNFLEIMKKYAIVGTLSVPVSMTEQAES
jgi:hypothetical protein